MTNSVLYESVAGNAGGAKMSHASCRIGCLVAVLLCSVLVASCGGRREPEIRDSLRSEARQVAWALEAYLKENGGVFPRTLGELSPRYIDFSRIRDTACEGWIAEEYVYFGPDGVTIPASADTDIEEKLMLLLLGPSGGPSRRSYYVVGARSTGTEVRTSFRSVTPRDLAGMLSRIVHSMGGEGRVPE